MTATRSDALHPSGDLLGHPKGLGFLFATEMWERFSYYGMRALLVLYMVHYLLRPGTAEGVLGLATLRRVLEGAAGPLDIQPLSSLIYGLYTSLVYFTPILGGLLADRVLGQRRTVIIGASLMAVGHFLMAVQSFFLPALFVLILGNGAFKPNISTQVGGLYPPGDPRRDRAFSIFYVGINLGATLAPWVCGILGEDVGWHYGFAAAGVGMVIGLVIYLSAGSALPPDALKRSRRETTTPDRVTWRAIAALSLLFLPTTLFWAAYEQQGNTIVLWTDDFTDRVIDLGIWRAEIPVTVFQGLNPALILAFTPFVVAFWARQARRGREPSTLTKMALGCHGVAIAYLMLALAAWRIAGGGRASWLWLAAYFVILTLGELYLSPVGLSLVTKLAPRRLLSTMMGVFLATSFIGNFLAGWLGSLWSSLSKPSFFLLIAAIAAGAGVAIGAMAKPLRPILEGR